MSGNDNGRKVIRMNPISQKFDAKILLADDELFMREIISNALTAGGYRNVQAASNLDLVREAITSNCPDLLILNGEMEQGRAVEMIRKIRLFAVGRNPFVPIIMTSWHSNRDFIHDVVECGVDLLLTKPLAAGQLLSRIEYLINARPPFIATATYIGPDRRGRERANDFPKFDAPNTLKDSVEGRVQNIKELQSTIAKTFAKVKHQRRCMQEQAIGKHFAVFMQQIRDSEPPADIAFVMESLTTLAVSYASDLSTMASVDAAEPAKNLVGALAQIARKAALVSEADLDRVADLLAELGIEIPSVADMPTQRADSSVNRQSETVN